MKPNEGTVNPVRVAARANPHALPHLVGETFRDESGDLYRFVRDKDRAATVRDNLGRNRRIDPALCVAARAWLSLRPEFSEWGQCMEVAVAEAIRLAKSEGCRFAGLVARLMADGTVQLWVETAEGRVLPLPAEVSRSFDRLKPLRRLTRRGSRYRIK